MTGNNIVGIIYSNIYDESLSEMKGLRTMGSVPFAGRYRLSDFPLSNMVKMCIRDRSRKKQTKKDPTLCAGQL